MENTFYPNSPFIIPIALLLRSTSISPRTKPDQEMSIPEKQCYDTIIEYAIAEARNHQFSMPLTGFKHSALVDSWLQYNGFRIVSGGHNDYLEW